MFLTIGCQGTMIADLVANLAVNSSYRSAMENAPWVKKIVKKHVGIIQLEISQTVNECLYRFFKFLFFKSPRKVQGQWGTQWGLENILGSFNSNFRELSNFSFFKIKFSSSFLDAGMHLYKMVCLSIDRRIGLSVCLLDGLSNLHTKV